MISQFFVKKRTIFWTNVLPLCHSLWVRHLSTVLRDHLTSFFQGWLSLIKPFNTNVPNLLWVRLSLGGILLKWPAFDSGLFLLPMTDRSTCLLPCGWSSHTSVFYIPRSRPRLGVEALCHSWGASSNTSQFTRNLYDQISIHESLESWYQC